MNFFEQQIAARRRSQLLVVYFALAVALIVLAINIAVFFAFHIGDTPLTNVHSRWPQDFSDPRLRWTPWVTTLTLLVISVGSLFRVWQLRRSGGAEVLRLLGGRFVSLSTKDPKERQLLNVVEEMAIASGIPMPEVYVLEHEDGINALAAGWGLRDAAIGVTHGTLKTMSRDELQGIIGHEFSHILYGDMRLNTYLLGVLNGILMIANLGRILVRSSSRGSRSRSSRGGGGGPVILIGAAMFVIGMIGVAFGRLIKSAVSRQREFLADAAAVQFTRNPRGIGSALRKIMEYSGGSALADTHRDELSHFFFADGTKWRLFNWTASHPPLADRVRRIDARLLKEEVAPDPRLNQLRADATLTNVGTMPPSALAVAGAMLAQMPQHFARISEKSQDLIAVALTAIWPCEPEFQEPAKIRVREILGEGLSPVLTTALSEWSQVAPEARFVAFTQAVNELRFKPKVFRDQMLSLLLELGELGAASPERAAMAALAAATLRTQNTAQVLSKNLNDLRGAILVILENLTRLGQDSVEKQQAAFTAGRRLLYNEYIDPKKISGTKTLNQAFLDLIALKDPRLRQKFLAACAATVSHDGQIAPQEYNLLRAVAAVLDSPLPLRAP